MSNADYISLTRQSGLMREMRVVANNIANASTAGFRQEGIVFSEFISPAGEGSVSMAAARVQYNSQRQGALNQTAAPLDLAIEGEGYFMIRTPSGNRLTRAGAFVQNDAGNVVTPEGYALLDSGEAPVFAPPGAGALHVGADGTMSHEGVPFAQVGVFVPQQSGAMRREDGVRFAPEGGVIAAPQARVLQGHLEESNVDPVMQMARMIEVQRAYELGQNLLDAEDERNRNAIKTLMK